VETHLKGKDYLRLLKKSEGSWSLRGGVFSPTLCALKNFSPRGRVYHRLKNEKETHSPEKKRKEYSAAEFIEGGGKEDDGERIGE